MTWGPSEDGSPRRGYPPERDLNAEEWSTNEPQEQTSVDIGASFSCRARGSNPGPPDIVILMTTTPSAHVISHKNMPQLLTLKSLLRNTPARLNFWPIASHTSE